MNPFIFLAAALGINPGNTPITGNVNIQRKGGRHYEYRASQGKPGSRAASLRTGALKKGPFTQLPAGYYGQPRDPRHIHPRSKRAAQEVTA